MGNLIFPLIQDTSRKIIHIDMDAFFASVEMRNNPSLKNKPVVIARHPRETNGRGVVSTCNYEARKYGIHSAMSAKEAFQLCPTAVFIPGNYEEYARVSREVQAIFLRYTDFIEPMSIDEAYLDVTKNKINTTSAIKIAKMIQYDIYHELHLTCSAGVSYNKFLAKLSSDFQKPAGLTVVLPEEALEFLKKMPIEKFHGVGKKSVEKMHTLAIHTGEDLYEKSEDFLIQEFGKMGYSLYRKVRGINHSPVKTTRERKSIGKERTYQQELHRETIIYQEIQHLCAMVETSLKKHKKHGNCVVLKVRYADFSTLTKRKTNSKYLYKREEINDVATEIYKNLPAKELGIRLLGVTVTHLTPLEYENIELPLWRKTT